MRIDRAAHLPWAIFVAVASALASLFYVAKFHPQHVPAGFRFFGETPPDHATIGGTPVGLVFGTISLGIFVFAALLGARKKLPFLPVGNVQRWLRAHIWLTLLTVPLILLHSGFHLGGPMTTLLMGIYAVVMVSGIYGLYLQHKMPTLMKERLPAEFVFEQIPNIHAQLCHAAEKLRRSLKQEAPMEIALSGVAATTVAPDNATDLDSAEALSTFIGDRLLPYLEARRGDGFRLGHAREAGEIFRHLEARVTALYRGRVKEMEIWCDQRRLLDLQTRMQHWMHSWLLVHVPVSFLLLLMTVWHAFVTVFRY
ncbi:MAG: hypothetical protein M3R10_01895 [Verrucomicrobiota bacterium]|nr:hypothetical protein [Verrucomicrobiota bacterium]